MIENAVTWLAVISPTGNAPEVFLFEEATQATPDAIYRDCLHPRVYAFIITHIRP